MCLAFGQYGRLRGGCGARAWGGVKLTGTWSYVLQHGSVTTSAEVAEKSATTQIHERNIVGASSWGPHRSLLLLLLLLFAVALVLALALLLRLRVVGRGSEGTGNGH